MTTTDKAKQIKQNEAIGKMVNALAGRDIDRGLELDYTESGSISLVEQLKTEIHQKLIELCSIADDNELILDVKIKTEYLNRSGNVGANAIMDFRVDMMEK